MQTYRPDKFVTVFQTHDGGRYWNWLNQDKIITIMETACYLRRPVVEAISPLLAQEFGADVQRIKVRQMIGHMVRQVLETRGYHLDRANVRIKNHGNSFHFGSAYTKTAA